MTASAKPCRVCAGTHSGFLAKKDGYAFSRCADCGFVFLDPMPAPEALAAQYAGDGAIDAGHYPKARSRMRRAAVKAWRFSRHIRGRDVLDVGCGGGFMVEAMRRRGARATGIDINPGAIAYAERHHPENRFYHEDLAAFARRGRAIDFVYSSEVLEHLPAINDFMDRLAQVTRAGGHVYITTPDIGHWRVPRDVTRWDVFSPPLHVQFFDAHSIRILFDRHGFTLGRKFFKLSPGLQILAQRR